MFIVVVDIVCWMCFFGDIVIVLFEVLVYVDSCFVFDFVIVL